MARCHVDNEGSKLTHSDQHLSDGGYGRMFDMPSRCLQQRRVHWPRRKSAVTPVEPEKAKVTPSWVKLQWNWQGITQSTQPTYSTPGIRSGNTNVSSNSWVCVAWMEISLDGDEIWSAHIVKQSEDWWWKRSSEARCRSSNLWRCKGKCETTSRTLPKVQKMPPATVL